MTQLIAARAVAPGRTATRLAVAGSAVHLPGPAPDALAGTALSAVPIAPAVPADRAAELLGRKGLLAKQPATRLALCAVHQALGRPDRRTGPADPDTAVVVASNLGNVGLVSDIARQVAATGVRAVSPLDAPSASSNIIASTVAIWFGLAGPNLTVCSGATAGLDAIGLAALLLRAGRAGRVVVVGAEPDDPDSVAVQSMRAGRAPAVPLRAGAACLILAVPDPAVPPAAIVHVPAWASDGGLPPVDATVGPAELGPALGDLYGAAGVVHTALAVAAIGAGARRIGVRDGDDVDGWRDIAVTAWDPS